MNRLRNQIFALSMMISALLWFPSCSKDDPTAAPPLPLPPSTAGSWSGTLTSGGRTGSVSLNFTQSLTRISGSGMLGTFTMTVNGEAHYPELQFTCTVPTYAPFVFTGTFTSPTTISGTVNGSGFINAVVELTKN